MHSPVRAKFRCRAITHTFVQYKDHYANGVPINHKNQRVCVCVCNYLQLLYEHPQSFKTFHVNQSGFSTYTKVLFIKDS